MKTPARIVLRWHLQHGLSAIPKSIQPERIAQNIDVFDFRLSSEDMARIDSLNSDTRSGQDPDRADTKLFPFTTQDVIQALRAQGTQVEFKGDEEFPWNSEAHNRSCRCTIDRHPDV